MLLQRLKVQVTETDSYHGQKHYQTVEDEATGSDERGGMKSLLRTRRRKGDPSPSTLGSRLQAAACSFPSQRVGENLQEEDEMRR